MRDNMSFFDCRWQSESIGHVSRKASMRTKGILAPLSGLILLFGCLFGPVTAGADAVTDWNLTAVNATLASGIQFNRGLVVLAYVHAAIYDAVNSIDGRYTVFAAKPTMAKPDASEVAATAAAAYNVLKSVFPAQQASLDAAFAASLAAVPNGSAKSDGVAIGEEVARGIMALRANDGLGAEIPYTFGKGPGVYQPTPPANGLPILQDLAHLKPFTLLSPSQFRADGPPALGSDRWARDYNEIKRMGAMNNSGRAPAQTQLALMFTENSMTFFARIFRDFAQKQKLSLADDARLFACLHVGMADALIAVFDSKYYYNAWRPITAIQTGDTDGNPLTAADPSWAPAVNTPPHPEYPAAHGVANGLVAETLRQFFHTKKITITFTSTVPNSGPPRVLTSTDQIEAQVIDARVYGGVHFRTSVEDAVKMGKQVGKWVALNYFRPVQADGQLVENIRVDDE